MALAVCGAGVAATYGVAVLDGRGQDRQLAASEPRPSTARGGPSP